MVVNKAQASLEHLYKVFTMPEGQDSKLAQIEQHLSDNLSDFLSQHIVASDTSLETLERMFDDACLPEDPQFVSHHAEKLLSNLVAHSVNTYSPRFIGHMTSALPYFHLSLAKLLVGLNQNPVKIETSKAFTPMERQTIGMMHRLVYQQDGKFYGEYLHSAAHSLGAFCSGGTIANITGLWVARNKALAADGDFSGVEQAGLFAAMRHYGYKDLVILCSKRAHYSLSKAMNVLGLGKDNLVIIDTNCHTLCAESALREGQAQQQKGNKVLAIVGIAGTTETGHIDPLSALAEVSEILGCHFHVDAAWGGATLFSDSHRHLLAGIERADSVTLDPHKQMYVPMGSGMVLFKHPGDSNAVRHHAQYILRQGSKDLGSTTLEGSRNGSSMMLYAAIHIFGREGYQLLIDQSIDKANRFAELIKRHPMFELTTEPTLCILTYRVCPQSVSQRLQGVETASKDEVDYINRLNVKVQKRQREMGQSFVSRTRLNLPAYGQQDISVFRVILANPLTTDEDLQAILDEQAQLARQLDSRGVIE